MEACDSTEGLSNTQKEVMRQLDSQGSAKKVE